MPDLRPVADIEADVSRGPVYQNAWLFEGEPELLMQCAAESKGPIVEIGSYHGGGTVCLARGSLLGGKQLVYAIDRHEEEGGGEFMRVSASDWMTWYLTVVGAGVDVVKLIRPIGLWSWEIVGAMRKMDEEIGFLFIDGDHSEKAASEDWTMFNPLVRDDGLVAFHDSQIPGPRAVLRAILDVGHWQILATAGSLTVLRRK
jgi:hypothetical protein